MDHALVDPLMILVVQEAEGYVHDALGIFREAKIKVVGDEGCNPAFVAAEARDRVSDCGWVEMLRCGRDSRATVV
jgi:hypothetical protein